MAASTGDANVVVTVWERDVTVGELRNATECFATGTAAELVHIARLATGEGEESFDVSFSHGQTSPGPVTSELLELLRDVMAGKVTDKETDLWLRDPFAPASEFCK
jgi:branched-subunit amino acid aminotransferase/4-amino-4-deoxychorismate lyase